MVVLGEQDFNNGDVVDLKVCNSKKYNTKFDLKIFIISKNERLHITTNFSRFPQEITLNLQCTVETKRRNF